MDGAVLPYLLIGLWLGLFGYSTFRLAAILAGGAAGASLGLHAGTLLGAPLAGIVLAVLGGLLGIALCFGAILIPLFVFGACVGFAAGRYLCVVFGPVSPMAFTLLPVLLGTFTGLVCLRLRRQFIVLGTSLVGAALCVDGAWRLFSHPASGLTGNGTPGPPITPAPVPGVPAGGERMVVAIAWLVLFLVFARHQSRAIRRRRFRRFMSADRYMAPGQVARQPG